MSEEDLALQALTEFLNAVEAGISAARQRIKTVKVSWNPGPFETVQPLVVKNASKR